MDFKAKGGETRNVGHDIVEWGVIIKFPVTLETYAVDGNTTCLHVAYQSIHFVGFGVEAFCVVIVVKEEGGRVGLMSVMEGKIDVVWAYDTKPERAAEATGIGYGFIDDVPSADTPAVVTHHGGDMGLHDIEEFCARPGVGFKPGWEAEVPDEGVTAHPLAVLLGELYEDVGL